MPRKRESKALQIIGDKIAAAKSQVAQHERDLNAAENLLTELYGIQEAFTKAEARVVKPKKAAVADAH